MSDTGPDAILDNVVYQNVNSLVGIPAGTKVILQFKGTSSVRIQLRPTQPVANSQEGVQLNYLGFYVIDAGESIIWAKGSGRLSVQVA